MQNPQGSLLGNLILVEISNFPPTLTAVASYSFYRSYLFYMIRVYGFNEISDPCRDNFVVFSNNRFSFMCKWFIANEAVFIFRENVLH